MLNPNEALKPSGQDDIKDLLLDLQSKINEQAGRLAALESKLAQPEENRDKPAPSLAVSPLGSEVPPPPPPFDRPAPSVATMSAAFASKPDDSKTSATAPLAAAPRRDGENLEERIAGAWFAKVGITALVLGLSFFLKYAFDNDWIGETGRVIMGVLAGLVLLAISEKLIRKYSVYAQIMTGGGLVMLYLSVYAAVNFYQLISPIAGFIFMILVTLGGIALSLRYNALALIITSVIGGFLTPILVSTGQNNFYGLFSYILMLDLAILVVSLFKKWNALNFLGMTGTAILFILWADKFYSPEQLFPVLAYLTVFFLVYSLSAVIFNLVKKVPSTGVEQMLTIISGTAYFGISYGLLNPDYHLFLGFFALLLAVYYFLWAYLVREVTPGDGNLYNFLAFLSVGFITVAVPIQLKQNIITISWTVEALLLFLLFLKTRQKTIQIFAIVVSILALGRLLFVDATMVLSDYAFILNKRFFTFVFAILASYAIGFLFKFQAKTERPEDRGNVVRLMATALVIANLLTIFSISQELLGYYNQKIEASQQSLSAYKKEHRYDPQSGKNAVDNKMAVNLAVEEARLRNRSSIALSIFWLVYSVILLVVGFAGKYKTVRVGGILLLILAVLKLFFYDLWSLGTLYRIISSICLGVVLLAISFVYQKYKNIIKENLI